MRVIAGEFRGRRLKTVKSKDTRPTSDKIKESVFQMMGPYFDGGTCLDLFAGSGSLGIEALSRGIDDAIFIEKSPLATKVVHTNINDLNLQKRARVYRNDAFRALHILKKQKKAFDLIFIDPPYGLLNDKDIINFIVNNDLLAENGLLYYEYDSSQKNISVDIDLSIVKQATYGTTSVTIFKNIQQ